MSLKGLDAWLSPPDDDRFCEICGKDVDNCVCPECQNCGSVGYPGCYESFQSDHRSPYRHRPSCGMIETNEQIASMAEAERFWEQEAASEAEYWKNYVEIEPIA